MVGERQVAGKTTDDLVHLPVEFAREHDHTEHERRRDSEGAHVEGEYSCDEKDRAENQDRQQLDGHNPSVSRC
jgi:hypothetical protein